MSQEFVLANELRHFPLWEKIKGRRAPLSFSLELTARCNNDCRHCYINLPTDDREAQGRELTREDIKELAREVASQGALWCLLTGGEPFLREDFIDIYLDLKRLGLLVSVFTNACLITREHVELFRKYPPRGMEVTVYGFTQETYEDVTRRPISFTAFRQGLDLMLNSGLKVHLKTMALRSNLHEFPEIRRFCREHTYDYFRFDPFLHLRYDGNPQRNSEIKAQRLTPEEIILIEQGDNERWPALQKKCEKLIFPKGSHARCNHLFICGAGLQSFTISPEGHFKLCDSLCHQECTYDLRQGSFKEAWEELVPQVRQRISQDPEFLEKCRPCGIKNLCLWCPAHAHLETGRLDAWVGYFCRVAKARANALAKSVEFLTFRR